jgi:hypothetical protein
MNHLPDGLTALREVMELGEIMRLIEQTARWVDPATFRLLPVWYPEHSRGSLFYKSDWSKPQYNTNRQTGHREHKREGNIHANKALTNALGYASNDRPNWSCCHIWGLDDPTFQSANSIVQDARYFSCVANMVLLPTPLKAFTDAMPEVKAMLRICSRNLYGWHCDHDGAREAVAVIERWSDWDAYPKSWPREFGATNIPGVVAINDTIRRFARQRVQRIKRDLACAGNEYPRKSVGAVLGAWKIDLEKWEADAPA